MFVIWKPGTSFKTSLPYFSPYVDHKIPFHILAVHLASSCLALLLTIITTAGYVAACNNLNSGVRYKKKHGREKSRKTTLPWISVFAQLFLCFLCPAIRLRIGSHGAT